MTENNEKGVTFSLNIEEVNSNADELIDLRGGGRYFGVADESDEIICRNCRKPGHIAVNCKVIVCLACGDKDDHLTDDCPKSGSCPNCGEKGHRIKNCPKKLKRLYCGQCGSKFHQEDRCVMVWRSYLTKPESDSQGRKSQYPYFAVYCYNCGAKGHYGDDCPNYRSSKVPKLDGSAFTGHNLPPSFRQQYWKIVSNSEKEVEDVGNFVKGNYADINDGNGKKKSFSDTIVQRKKSKKERKKAQKLEKKNKTKSDTKGKKRAFFETDFASEQKRAEKKVKRQKMKEKKEKGNKRPALVPKRTGILPLKHKSESLVPTRTKFEPRNLNQTNFNNNNSNSYNPHVNRNQGKQGYQNRNNMNNNNNNNRSRGNYSNRNNNNYQNNFNYNNSNNNNNNNNNNSNSYNNGGGYRNNNSNNFNRNNSSNNGGNHQQFQNSNVVLPKPTKRQGYIPPPSITPSRSGILPRRGGGGNR